MESRRKPVIVGVALGVTMAVGGWLYFGIETTGETVELSEDQRLIRERQAIERLKEKGCHAEERTDNWIGESGILLRLFPEHIDENGFILSDVFADLRFLRRCFLVLDGTPVSNEGLGDLKRLDNLLLLSLQSTPITDDGLGHIEGIISLKLLRLNRTGITDHGLRYIDRLPDLVMLYLSHTQITDDAMPHLVALSKLAALKLSFTAVTNKTAADLKLFSNLEFAGLDGTAISDEGLPHLRACPKLTYVNLTSSNASLDAVETLREEMPDCNIAFDTSRLLLPADSREARRPTN